MTEWEPKQLNHAIHPEAHPAEYVWHKYWARKPHNVVRSFIEHYCPPGGLVLDPFSGSGVTAIEAVRTGRRAIAVDINPIASEILRSTLLPINTEELRLALEAIESKVKGTINALYSTHCRKCHKEIPAAAFIWNRKQDNSHHLSEVRYRCSNCGDQQISDCRPTKHDLALATSIDKSSISHWYPKFPFKYADGTEFREGPEAVYTELSDLFTARNLLALSLIRDTIDDQFAESALRMPLLAILTSMVHLSSRMCPVRPSRPFSSLWAVHRYWVPPTHMELNVWDRWESASIEHQSFVSAKEATNASFNGVGIATRISELGTKNRKKEPKLFMALALPWLLAERKLGHMLRGKPQLANGYVDYVFTDPPYDAEIQYGELSALWNAWFYGPTFDWNEYVEILRQWETVNNPQQGKDFSDFSTNLYQNFRSILDVMKPGAYMHLTFHSPSQKVRNSVIRSAVHAGYIYERIHYQPGARLNPKGLLQPYGSAQGDYIFRFRKPTSFAGAMDYVDNGLIKQIRDRQSFNNIVIGVTKKLLAERSEPVPFTFIINHLDPVLNDHGFYLQYHADWNVEDVLANSGEFVLKTIEIAGKSGRAWWYADETEALKSLTVPLTERVEIAVLSILKKHGQTEFTNALNEVYIRYPNSLTPDGASVKAVLEEYAERSKGVWVLSKREIEVESQHSAMIHYIAQIGVELGFGIAIGKRESGEMHLGQRLGDLSTGEPDWTPFSSEDVNRLQQIDCLWLEGGVIKYVFEVENTTQFTEAMIRSQALDHVRRLFIVPKHRAKYIQKRLSNQLFAELVSRQGWRFLPYESLSRLANRRIISADDVWSAAVLQFEIQGGSSPRALPKTERGKRNTTKNIFD